VSRSYRDWRSYRSFLQDVTRRSRGVDSVFFLLTNPYDLYLRPVYPIIEEFRAARARFLALTTDSSVIRNLGARGVACLDLRVWPERLRLNPFLPRKYKEAMRNFFCRLAEIIPSSRPQSLEESLLGVLWHSGVAYLVHQSILLVDMFAHILGELRPKSVFTMPDCSPVSDLLCAVARSLGIPTVTTLAASVGNSLRSLGVYRADRIAVYGRQAERVFAEMGYDPERIVLTGDASFDSLARTSDLELRAARERLGLSKDKRTLLIATSRFDLAEAGWIRRFIEVARRRGNLQIVVKIHPNFTLADYGRLAQEAADAGVPMVRDGEVRPLIALSDAVVTDYSHVGKEALLLGKPLLTVNLTGGPFPANRYEEEGLALGVKSIEGIEMAIERVFEDPALRESLAKKRQEMVGEYFYKADGGAAKRIFRLLMAPGVHRLVSRG
jgi:hypothetical protein